MYLNWPTMVSLGLSAVMAEIRGPTEVTEALTRSTCIAGSLFVLSTFRICPKATVSLTLGLHTCPNESEGIGCQLAAGAGDGAAAQQDQNSGICRIYAVPLEPGVLQSLKA